MIGMRFIMGGGTFLQVRMPADEAARIFESWQAKAHKFYQGVEPGAGGVQWAVEAEAIKAMHTYPLEQTPTTPPQPGQFRSGVQFPMR